MYTIFVGASFGSLPDLYSKLIKAIGATEHLMDLIDEDGEIISSEPNNLNLRGDMTFKDVSFQYPSRPDVKVIESVSFSVKAGQKIAIVGGSGAGKSTLAGLILRFYDVNSGSINIDNKPISDFDLAGYRNEMAIVPQEVILFGGTIAENIAYGKPDASQAEIEAAASKANVHTFVTEFPEGYETLVGDRGIQLSGGQRQRIAIARAILKDPIILILDEATSSLDSESEREVNQALEILMKDRTSFVIAHRLSTIRDADKILVMHKGELAESGTHDELFNLDNGIYRKLCELQFFKE